MNVLITRQIDQSKKFSSLLNEKNIKNIIFPVIYIENISLTKKNIKDIESAELIIFTSQNAVSSIKSNLSSINISNKKIAAIGKSTEKYLNELNINVDITPKKDFTSEALLAEIKDNKIINNKVLIVKGMGGRDLLHNEISKNNIILNDLNIYKRCLPKNFNNLNLNEISHICITSIEILNNFSKIMNIMKKNITENMIFVCGNQRIANEVLKIYKNNKLIISKNPSNKEMLKTLLS